MKHLLLCLIAGVAVAAGLPAFGQEKAGVTISPAGGKLERNGVLLLSFPTPMVDVERLDRPAESPILFNPPLTGHFTWTSEKSGEFVVLANEDSYDDSSEEGVKEPLNVMSLKTLRRVRLRPELRDLAGRVVKDDNFGAVFAHADFDISRVLRLGSADFRDGILESVDLIWEMEREHPDRNEGVTEKRLENIKAAKLRREMRVEETAKVLALLKEREKEREAAREKAKAEVRPEDAEAEAAAAKAAAAKSQRLIAGATAAAEDALKAAAAGGDESDADDGNLDLLPALPFYRIEFTREVEGAVLPQRVFFKDAQSGEKVPVEVALESFQPVTKVRSSWVVTAARSLPPGRTWLLVADRIPSATKSAEPPAPVLRVVALGETEQFKVLEGAHFNQPGNGSFVQVDFSSNLDEGSVVPANFSVTPAVSGLKVEVLGLSSVEISGGFEQGKSYIIEVKPGVRSAGGQVLPGPWTMQVTFQRQRPAVIMADKITFMPRENGVQYDLRHVNTGALSWRLAAVPLGLLFDVEHKMSDFSKDQERDEKTNELVYSKTESTIDFFKLGVVAEGTMPSTEAELDAEKTSRVSWMPPAEQHAGTFLLEVTGLDLQGRKIGNRCLISLGDWTMLHKEDGVVHLQALSVLTGKAVPHLTAIARVEKPQKAEKANEGDTEPEAVAKRARPNKKNEFESATVVEAEGEHDWRLVRGDARGFADLDEQPENFLALTDRAGPLAEMNIKTLTDYSLWKSAAHGTEGGGAFDLGMESDSDMGELPPPQYCNVVTDRAVYRPGETFYFKGYIRAIAAGQLPQVPPPVVVRWQIVAGRGYYSEKPDKVLGEGLIKSDEFGSWHGSWPIPRLAYGAYRLVFAPADKEEAGEDARWGGQVNFSVNDDRSPAFSVVVTPVESQGDTARIRVRSVFFHGAPAARAKVRWRAAWTEGWWHGGERDLGNYGNTQFPDGSYHKILFTDDESEDGVFHGLSRDAGYAYREAGWQMRDEHYDVTGGYDEDAPPLAVVTGEAEMDAQGQAVIQCRMPMRPERVRGRCRVQWSVEVVSTEGLSHEGGGISRVQPPPMVIGVATRGGTNGLNIAATALDFQEHHLPGVKLHARVFRVDYKPLKEPVSPGLVRYKNTPVYVLTWEGDLNTPVQTTVPVEGPGHYVCSVNVPGMPQVPQVSDWSDMTGGTDAETPMYGPYDLSVLPAKGTYNAGDTARFIVNAPYAGMAAISVETDHILHQENVELRANLDSFKLELKPEWFPNAFITVHLLKPVNGALPPAERFGGCELFIQRPDLDIVVTPQLDAAGGSVLPGAEVTGNVLVQAGGRPVKGADVLLYAVDESALELGHWQMPDFRGTWFPPNVHQVKSYPTLNAPWRPTLTRDLSRTQKGYILGDGRGFGQNTLLRKKFSPIATWQSSLRTGEDGRAFFTFRATEDLTTFRVTAVASSTNSLIGDGRAKLRQHKPLQVAPHLPRFVREGDLLNFRASVQQDFSPEVLRARLTLNPDPGLEALDPLSATATLPGSGGVTGGGGSALLGFRGRVKPGATQLKLDFAAKAAFSGETHADGVSLTLPVLAPRLERQRFVYGKAAAKPVGAALAEQFQAKASGGGGGKCDLIVSSSPWLPVLDRLTRYNELPHSTLDHAVRLLRSTSYSWSSDFIPGSIHGDRAKTAEIVDKSIEAFRQADWNSPGLAEWPCGAEPDTFASLFACLSLVMADKEGYEVPQSLFDALADWSVMAEDDSGRDMPIEKSEEDKDQAQDKDKAQAQAHHTSAIRPFACWLNAVIFKEGGKQCAKLYKERGELGQEGLAFLALALAALEQGPEKVTELLGDLNEPPAEAQGAAKGGGPPSEGSAAEHRTRLRTAGICAYARAALSGAGWTPEQRQEEVQKAEQTLTAAGDLAPQEAIWWQMALDTMMRSLPLAKLDTASLPLPPDAVSANGCSVAWLNRPLDSLSRDFAKMQASAASGSWLLRVHGADPAGSPAGGGDLVLASSRRNLTNAKRTGSKDAPFRIGDRVLINYRLESAQSRRFIQLDDQLPACLEPVNTDLASIPEKVGVPAALRQRAMSLSSAERRDDRLVLVFDTLDAQTDSYSVMMRVNAAGEFHWPAPVIHSLYDGGLRAEGLDTMAYAKDGD